jgi:hypothetical protein
MGEEECRYFHLAQRADDGCELGREFWWWYCCYVCFRSVEKVLETGHFTITKKRDKSRYIKEKDQTYLQKGLLLPTTTKHIKSL